MQWFQLLFGEIKLMYEFIKLMCSLTIMNYIIEYVFIWVFKQNIIFIKKSSKSVNFNFYENNINKKLTDFPLEIKIYKYVLYN
jgi:hypothetical protein